MQRVSPDRYWFKRRRYGYGWVPIRWQGWAAMVVLVVIGVLTALGLEYLIGDDNEPRFVMVFVGLMVIEVGAFLMVCLKYSPVPKWRWGARLTDDPQSDW